MNKSLIKNKMMAITLSLLTTVGALAPVASAKKFNVKSVAAKVAVGTLCTVGGGFVCYKTCKYLKEGLGRAIIAIGCLTLDEGNPLKVKLKVLRHGSMECCYKGKFC